MTLQLLEPSRAACRRAAPETIERVALRVEPHDCFANYLKTKKEKMGHLVNVA